MQNIVEYVQRNLTDAGGNLEPGEFASTGSGKVMHKVASQAAAEAAAEASAEAAAEASAEASMFSGMPAR